MPAATSVPKIAGAHSAACFLLLFWLVNALPKLLIALLMLLPGGMLVLPILWLARRREAARLARQNGPASVPPGALPAR